MLTRTLTLAGSPNLTHTLYFDSRSNAAKPAETIEGRDVLKDDYGQTLVLHQEAVVISDLLQDGSEMMRAQGEMKIVEIKAQTKLQKRFNDDAELKVMREAAARQAAAEAANSSAEGQA